jgi:hypothetical protein
MRVVLGLLLLKTNKQTKTQNTEKMLPAHPKGEPTNSHSSLTGDR